MSNGITLKQTEAVISLVGRYLETMAELLTLTHLVCFYSENKAEHVKMSWIPNITKGHLSNWLTPYSVVQTMALNDTT